MEKTKEKVFKQTLEEKYGESGKIGDWGEEKVKSHLESLGYEDVQKHKGVQRQVKGHDISCKLHGEEHNISVKTNLKNGKFFVEKSKNKRPGWWIKENARLYYFVEFKGNKMIEVTKDALEEYILEKNPYYITYKGTDELYPINEEDFLKYFKDRKECKLWLDK